MFVSFEYSTNKSTSITEKMTFFIISYVCFYEKTMSDKTGQDRKRKWMQMQFFVYFIARMEMLHHKNIMFSWCVIWVFVSGNLNFLVTNVFESLEIRSLLKKTSNHETFFWFQWCYVTKPFCQGTHFRAYCSNSGYVTVHTIIFLLWVYDKSIEMWGERNSFHMHDILLSIIILFFPLYVWTICLFDSHVSCTLFAKGLPYVVLKMRKKKS